MKAYFDTGGSDHAYAHAQTHGHGDILADASSSVDKSFCLSDALFFVRIWLLLEQEKREKVRVYLYYRPPLPSSYVATGDGEGCAAVCRHVQPCFCC